VRAPDPSALLAALRTHAAGLGAAVLGGLCGAAGFPLVIEAVSTEPLLDAGPRELFILVPAAILYRFAELPGRRAAGYGFAAGVVFFAVLIGWVKVAMVRFGGMPEWQAVPVLALLVGWCALFWGALPPLARVIASRTFLPRPIAFTAAVVGLEWLRGVALTGFPWGLWGYSQARNAALLQLAGIAGVYAVSAVLALAGALAADALASRRRGGGLGAFLPLALVVIGAHAIGAARSGQEGGAAGPAVRVAVVQGNLEPRLGGRDPGAAERTRARYLELSRSVAASVDWLVWPEAAWPGWVSSETGRLFVESLGVRLLTGAATLTPTREPRNSAFALDAGGRVTGRYDKRHLVPFGEYVPLRAFLPVDRIVPGLRDFVAGESAAPLGEPAAGVLICYDGVFPELARDAARAGAEVLVSITNDGWYGVSGAPYQHRDFYALRAVETDRWVVRAANTGVSGFIDPAGRLSGFTALGETTVSAAAIEPRAGLTFYVRHGDWLVAIALGIALAALLDLAVAAARRQIAARRPQPAAAIDTRAAGGQ
jgi:apolipoprotein N-acyltransferase